MLTALNFGFLKGQDARLSQLGTLAEHNFRQDPTTAIMKLRQFAELLAKLVAANSGVYIGEHEKFEETLRRLAFERYLPRDAADVFHALRRSATSRSTRRAGAMGTRTAALKLARRLGIWLYRAYARQPSFNPDPVHPAAGADRRDGDPSGRDR